MGWKPISFGLVQHPGLNVKIGSKWTMRTWLTKVNISAALLCLIPSRPQIVESGNILNILVAAFRCIRKGKMEFSIKREIELFKPFFLSLGHVRASWALFRFSLQLIRPSTV
jgi:hypothetical protein